MTIETKADLSNGELRAAMREFLGAFEAFKSANDERLGALEEKRADDVVLGEKIERINAAMSEQKALVDRLALKSQRPPLARERAAPEPDERKAAFSRYMRAGDASAMIEAKSVNTVNDGEGGYLAPDEVERLVTAAVRDVSPLRQIASVRQIGGNLFRKPVSNGDAASGWVAETTARTETTAPTLTAIDFPTMELYAMPAASQTLLDDAIVDVGQWLADEVQSEFAVQESAAFIAGNGTTAPKGILSYDIAADATKDPDELGYIATGAAGAFPASNPSDVLLDLIYAPRQAYRANGRFLMNRSVVGAIRKFKDGEGNYLWQPNVEPGEPARLMGYPLAEAEDMPDIGADAHAIAFGDFRRCYLIVDRAGLRVLRDPFSAKPYVLFYTTKRVGGGVQDFDAVKFLKFAAS